MHSSHRLLLVGGGSGGHIVPNLAIATKLRSDCGSALRGPAPSSRGPNSRLEITTETTAKPQLEILYIGSRNPLDRQLVEQADIPFKSIFTGKLRRYFSWKNFIDPLFLLMGFFQSIALMITYRPHLIFSKGGFVSVPVALAGFLFRVPIILHESDSRMGLANRFVSRMATKICTSFPDLMKEDKRVFNVGNPVRLSIQAGNAKKGYELTGFNDQKPVILVWGGSQGAQQINDLIAQEWPLLKKEFQVIHVTGKNNSMKVIKGDQYKNYEYIGDELGDIYAITDIMVGRAGANSLFEMAVMQKPNILIPLNNADQLNNADYFESRGASLVWQKGDSLAKMLIDLSGNSQQMNQMKEALKKLARPQATKDIVELIIKEIKDK